MMKAAPYGRYDRGGVVVRRFGSTTTIQRTYYQQVECLHTWNERNEQVDVPLDGFGRGWNLTSDRFTISPYSVYNTLEWRAFDSAADWDMQEAHIAFVQRYVDVILKNSKRFTPAPFTKNQSLASHRKTLREALNVYRYNIDLCIHDFKALIVDALELPWARYEPYIERNLVPAFEWGKRR